LDRERGDGRAAEVVGLLERRVGDLERHLRANLTSEVLVLGETLVERGEELLGVRRSRSLRRSSGRGRCSSRTTGVALLDDLDRLTGIELRQELQLLRSHHVAADLQLAGREQL